MASVLKVAAMAAVLCTMLALSMGQDPCRDDCARNCNRCNKDDFCRRNFCEPNSVCGARCPVVKVVEPVVARTCQQTCALPVEACQSLCDTIPPTQKAGCLRNCLSMDKCLKSC